MRPPALVLAACVVSLACHPEATATPLDLAQLGGPGLIFDDVHVFGGVADLGVVDVLVEGHQITHVGPVALDTLPPASNVVVISGGGKLTLLPGLIDAHAHVSGPPDLASALSHGVTTVLDQFMDEQTMGRIERQQANGRLFDHSELTLELTLWPRRSRAHQRGPTRGLAARRRRSNPRHRGTRAIVAWGLVSVLSTRSNPGRSSC
jgi:hypothetical protein